MKDDELETVAPGQMPVSLQRQVNTLDRLGGYNRISIALHVLMILAAFALGVTAYAGSADWQMLVAWIATPILLGGVIWRLGRGFARTIDGSTLFGLLARLTVIAGMLAALAVAVSNAVMTIDALPVPMLPLPSDDFLMIMRSIHAGGIFMLLASVAAGAMVAAYLGATRQRAALLRIVTRVQGGL